MRLSLRAKIVGPFVMVVALVSIDDLDWSSQQRTAVVVGGTLALMLVLMLIAVVQARAIAGPLENLVDVADALVRGEYRRVAPSRNHEVHALGQAVSALASQLERKLAQLTHHATRSPARGTGSRSGSGPARLPTRQRSARVRSMPTRRAALWSSSSSAVAMTA